MAYADADEHINEVKEHLDAISTILGIIHTKNGFDDYAEEYQLKLKEFDLAFFKMGMELKYRR